MTLRRLARNASAILLGCGLVLQTANLFAETMSEKLARKTQGNASSQGDKDKMLVEADEIVYDRDKNTVAAVGNAHLFYQGKVVEADRVVYDRATKRVTAIGNAKMTESAGQVVTGEKIELTDDFKNAYIDSLRMTTPDKTRMSSPRVEREGGETTVFESALYTACEPCKDDPAKPPFWQVRAARIIHKNSERRVYYENATIEFAGVPVAWVPYFSAPDSTVKRESGFLAPRFVMSSALGYGVQTPYFFNLAPNYDVTFRPTFLSNQGVLGDLEWRHRLETGSYAVRVAGIYQMNPDAFSPAPFGAGNKEFRGSAETYGKFLINEQWRWGWDLAMASDKWFLRNYKIPSPSLTQFGTTNFLESTSTLYLNGQGDRSYFNAAAYYFRVLSYADWQKRQPVVPDVIDYDRTFQGGGQIAGDWRVNFNTATLVRQETDFRSLVTAAGLPGTYNFPMANTALYTTCAPGYYNPQNCIIRGLAGTYTRATTSLDWKRTVIDPIGMSWTPFGFVRGDVALPQLSMNGGPFNQFLSNFIDTNDQTLTRGMTGAGMTWRYPFLGQLGGTTHVIEPVAQIITRPNETGIRQFPNEDAISLIYDDSNLFSVDKFTGYDRVEGGTRANVGLNYTMQFDGGGTINALVGQSYQLAGMNSFSQFSLSRTGLESGLDTARSDYVGRIQYTPSSGWSVLARGRFDVSSYEAKTLEVQSAYSFNSYIAATVAWARYLPQPLLGIFNTRNGFVTGITVRPDPKWWASATLSFDVARYQRDNGFPQVGGSDPWPSVPGFSIGAGYKDECTTIGVTYSNVSGSSQGITTGRAQTVMLRLELRTLGGTTISQSSGAASSSSAN